MLQRVGAIREVAADAVPLARGAFHQVAALEQAHPAIAAEEAGDDALRRAAAVAPVALPGPPPAADRVGTGVRGRRHSLRRQPLGQPAVQALVRTRPTEQRPGLAGAPGEHGATPALV